MRQEVTDIKVIFKGAKRDRSVKLHFELVEQIKGHKMLTPDEFNKYERKAWQLIESKGYKDYKSAKLNVYHGAIVGATSYGEILEMALFPKQTQIIMKG